MRKFLLSAILTSFIALATFTGASAEFFRDIIITSPNALWTDSRAYTTLNDAISAVGSNERTIKIVSPQVVTVLTIPSNITLEFTRDGSITNSGQLTFETDSIIAPNRQIFTGTGDIDFVAGSVIKSSWFANLDTALDLTNDDTLTLIITKSESTTASMAVGDSVTLRWNSPFIITSLTGHTVSNIKNIEAGNYQLFAGAGDFDFLDGTVLKLNWFDGSSVLTWVEAEEVTILINEQTDVISDLTTSANENIKILPGGSISINTGVTLTLGGNIDLKGTITGAGNLTILDTSNFNCSGGIISVAGTSTIGNNFNAGNYQILTGAGAVNFASGSEVKSAWFSDFETAITKVGTDEVKLIVSSASSIVNDCTVNVNTSLSIPSKGRILTVASTKTLTINGSLEVGLYQVFSGDGSISFGPASNGTITPQMWGASPTATPAVNTAAIQKSLNSVPIDYPESSYVKWLLPPGNYEINSDITVTGVSYATFEFQGKLIAYDCNGFSFVDMIQIKIIGYFIVNKTRNWTVSTYGLRFVNISTSDIDIEVIVGFEKGLYLNALDGCTCYNKFSFQKLYNNKYHMYFDTVETSWINENSFYDGRFGLDSGVAAVETTNWVLYCDLNSPSNNNRFINPCYEGNFNGLELDNMEYVLLQHPRFEGVDANWVSNLGYGSIWMQSATPIIDVAKIANIGEYSRGVTIIGGTKYPSGLFRSIAMSEGYGGLTFFESLRPEVQLNIKSLIHSALILNVQDYWGQFLNFNKAYEGTDIPTLGTYRKNAVVWNTNVASAQICFWACSNPGTMDADPAITGSITAGDRFSLVVSSATDLVIGQYINIAGDSGIRQLERIDYDTGECRLFYYSGGDITDGAVTFHAATWVAGPTYP